MNKLTNVMIASALLAASGSVLADGQKTYQSTCQACHASGAAGAPKLGDKDAWAPRIATQRRGLSQRATGVMRKIRGS